MPMEVAVAMAPAALVVWPTAVSPCLTSLLRCFLRAYLCASFSPFLSISCLSAVAASVSGCVVSKAASMAISKRASGVSPGSATYMSSAACASAVASPAFINACLSSPIASSPGSAGMATFFSFRRFRSVVTVRTAARPPITRPVAPPVAPATVPTGLATLIASSILAACLAMSRASLTVPAAPMPESAAVLLAFLFAVWNSAPLPCFLASFRASCASMPATTVSKASAAVPATTAPAPEAATSCLRPASLVT